jgi:DNA primase
VAGQIPEETVREVLKRTSIVKLVSEYVSLRKAGARWVGLCPFHGEKTPSLSVNEELGFFHCFGCGESGDAISFLRKQAGMSFLDALQQLAARAGIQLAEMEGGPNAAQRAKARDEKQRLYDIVGAAGQWYHKRLLNEPRSSSVWDYVRSRGLSDDTVAQHRLGFAPPEWGELTQWLQRGGMSLDAAEKAGLVAPKKQGGGYYDRFRARLMFPICDLSGRAVGFGGRILPQWAEPESAKYINSPDTPIFTKGELLFGLHAARTGIRGKGRALVVEGNIDLLSLHQAGFTEAVAPMGTALTHAQMQLLGRFTERVTLLYDGDRAGRAAARKALELALELGMQGSVALLPDGQDPDSFVRQQGPHELATLLDRAPSLLDHLLDSLIAHHGRTEDGKAKILGELSPIVQKIRDFRQHDLYVSRIAGALDLAEQRVLRLLSGDTPARQTQTSSQRGTDSVPPPSAASGPVSAPLTPAPQRERQLVQWCLAHPECLELAEQEDACSLVSHDALRGVLWEAIVQNGELQRLDPGELLNRLRGSPLQAWAGEVLTRGRTFSEAEASGHVANALVLLREQQREGTVRELQQAIRRAEANGDRAQVAVLAQELTRAQLAKKRGRAH